MEPMTRGHVLARAKRAGLPEHGVDERRFAVINVSDDGDVPEVLSAVFGRAHGGRDGRARA